jgi:hypothetical protein
MGVLQLIVSPARAWSDGMNSSNIIHPAIRKKRLILIAIAPENITWIIPSTG